MNTLRPISYQSEIWSIQKDDVYASIRSIEAGLDHARECLAVHDVNLGRDTRKNKQWAETIESDIAAMETILHRLRRYDAVTMPLP